MSEEERERKYEELVFSGIGAGETQERKRERRKDALGRAHEIRKFEIELYWKRALYFWGFEIVLVGALAAVVSSGERDVVSLSLAVALSVMGLFISIAWHFMSKGGKAWQENWERHIDFLEDDYEGRLHKIVIGDEKQFYSVSRINQDVIKVWSFFWFVVFLGLLMVSIFLLYSRWCCCDFLFCCEMALEFSFCPRWYLCSYFEFALFALFVALVVAILIFFVSCCRWKTKRDDKVSDDTCHIHTREKKLK